MGPCLVHLSWVLTLVNALPESISSRCMPGTHNLGAYNLEVMANEIQAGVVSSR